MSEAHMRTAVTRREADNGSTPPAEQGERLPSSVGLAEAATHGRGTPWLAESSPQAWDSYASQGGLDYLIADCGSPESHERRLRALLQLPIEEGESLLEFGCGTGRLADFTPAGVQYEGLDWSGEIVTLARSRRPHATFHRGSVGDIMPHDWVVASGPFNYAQGWSKSQTAGAVAIMWNASRRGIALTVLRTPAEDRLHYNNDELISFLATCDWSQLELDRSYLPNDICVRAWREA